MTRQLNQLERIVAQFRKDFDDLPLRHIQALLWIARNEGAEAFEMRDRLDIPSSATARITAQLGEGLRREPGLRFIDVVIDPDDRRRRRLHLTPKGRAAVQRAARIIQEA